MLAFLVAAAALGNAPRILPTADLHAVELAAGATVLIAQAPATSVVATGDPRLVRCVTTQVRDGRLVIGWAGSGGKSGRSRATGDEIVVTARPDCPHGSDPQRLLIRVAAPRIDAIAIRERGIVRASGIRTPALAASISGRGSITIDGLTSGLTSFAIPGIGRIAATGELGRLQIDVPGQGIIDTRSAHARAIAVSVGGGGDIAASVDGPAAGTLAGTGTIAISGHPDCAIRKTGKGRIICPAAPSKGSHA